MRIFCGFLDLEGVLEDLCRLVVLLFVALLGVERAL